MLIYTLTSGTPIGLESDLHTRSPTFLEVAQNAKGLIGISARLVTREDLPGYDEADGDRPPPPDYEWKH